MTDYKLAPVLGDGLLPCPFCGGDDIGNRYIETYSCDSSYDIFGCKACGAGFNNDDQSGPSLWNRRDAAPAVQGEPIEVECRQCGACGHVGIDDHRDDHAACHGCDWKGPEPEQDKCPGCGKTDCMAAACPACGSRYELRDTKVVTAPQPAEQQSVMNWRNCYHRASMDLCDIGELLGVPEEDQCTPDIIEAIKALQQPNPLEQAEPMAWMHDSPGRVDVIHAAVKKLLVDSHDTAGHLHRPLDKSEHYTIPLYATPAMKEPEVMKNAMQLAQGPMPTTLGELHDYLDSIRKAWSAQDTKYLGSYESQPLYILPNDPTPGFHLASAKYFAEFGLTFIPVEGASK